MTGNFNVTVKNSKIIDAYSLSSQVAYIDAKDNSKNLLTFEDVEMYSLSPITDQYPSLVYSDYATITILNSTIRNIHNELFLTQNSRLLLKDLKIHSIFCGTVRKACLFSSSNDNYTLTNTEISSIYTIENIGNFKKSEVIFENALIRDISGRSITNFGFDSSSTNLLIQDSEFINLPFGVFRSIGGAHLISKSTFSNKQLGKARILSTSSPNNITFLAFYDARVVLKFADFEYNGENDKGLGGVKILFL